MRLYIIRHADPDYENNTITPDGHLEAKALAKRLVSHGLDRIYSSPAGRARHTMQYTAELLNMDHKIEDWTLELDGLRIDDTPWGPIQLWDVPGEVIRGEEFFPTHDTWNQLEFAQRTKINEIFENVKRFSDEFLKRHGYERVGGKYRCINPNQEKIAVFCHCGFGLTWLSHLLEIPLTLMWSGFWLPPSSVTTILFDERSKDWAVPRCIGLGDVSHLYSEGLPVKPRGIKTNYY